MRTFNTKARKILIDQACQGRAPNSEILGLIRDAPHHRYLPSDARASSGAGVKDEIGAHCALPESFQLYYNNYFL